MPSIVTRLAARLPGLRRLPIFKLLALAEIARLAQAHVTKLDAAQRRRFLHLLKQGKGRGQNLTPAERSEFATLVAKLEPRLFAGVAADKLSPVPLPKRVTHGPKSKRAA